MRLLWLLASIASFFSFAEKQSAWIEVIPPNFNDLEHFFTQSNCKAVLGVSYIYNTKTGHWLPYEQAIALYPNENLHLALQSPRKSENGSCSIYASKTKLKDVLGIHIKDDSEHVLLFFDAFYSIKGKRNSFHPDFDKKMKQRYLAITSFDSMPKYHIKVNSLGLKSQNN